MSTERKIRMYVISNPGCSIQNLIDDLGIQRQQVMTTIKSLLSKNLVRKERLGEGRGSYLTYYSLVDSEEETMNLGVKEKLIIQCMSASPITIKQISDVSGIPYHTVYDKILCLRHLGLVLRAKDTRSNTSLSYTFTLTARGIKIKEELDEQPVETAKERPALKDPVDKSSNKPTNNSVMNKNKTSTPLSQSLTTNLVNALFTKFAKSDSSLHDMSLDIKTAYVLGYIEGAQRAEEGSN